MPSFLVAQHLIQILLLEITLHLPGHPLAIEDTPGHNITNSKAGIRVKTNTNNTNKEDIPANIINKVDILVSTNSKVDIPVSINLRVDILVNNNTEGTLALRTKATAPRKLRLFAQGD